MTAPAIVGAGYARVSWGRWVVDCGHPLCSSALTLGPDVEVEGDGIRRGLRWGQDSMQCWDCDHVTELIFWPADPAAVQMLLRQRPDIRTRNWDPSETLEDLLAENIEHGLMPPGLDLAGPTTPLMITANGRVAGGLLLEALPFAEQRRKMLGGN